MGKRNREENIEYLTKWMALVKNFGLGALASSFSIIALAAVEVAGWQNVKGFDVDAAVMTAARGCMMALGVAYVAFTIWLWLRAAKHYLSCDGDNNKK